MADIYKYLTNENMKNCSWWSKSAGRSAKIDSAGVVLPTTCSSCRAQLNTTQLDNNTLIVSMHCRVNSDRSIYVVQEITGNESTLASCLPREFLYRTWAKGRSLENCKLSSPLTVELELE